MRFFNIRRFIIVLLLLQLMHGSVAFAIAEEIINKDLNIYSSKLVIDKIKNRAVFSGKVRILFKDMELRADRIEVFYDKNGTKGGTKDGIDRIVIPGKLRLFKDCGREMALAKQGIFYAKDNKLELMDEVILQMDDKILKTDNFVYYTSLKIN